MDSAKKIKNPKVQGEKDRVPPFFRELQDKCKMHVDLILVYAVLSASPKPGCIWHTYLMDKGSVLTNMPLVYEESIKIYLAFQNFDKTGTLNKIFIKGFKLECIFIYCLCDVMAKYEFLTTIQLKDCKLTKASIEQLHKSLLQMPNINNLNLDDNPIFEQNLGLFGLNEHLLYLSLKRCKINESGIKFMCYNILQTLNSKLQILNLTGNFVCDNGTIFVEKLIRSNRTLKILILADNWISDIGCCQLMNGLQQFTLTHEEIKLKRSLNFKYYIEKHRLINQLKKEKEADKPPPPPPPVHHKPATPKKKKPPSPGKNKTQSPNPQKPVVEQVQINACLEQNLQKIKHPFLSDTIQDNDIIMCYGNFSLSFLNLSYNSISVFGYRHIISMLNYQLPAELEQCGILYIVLNGNQDLHTPEFEEIARLVLEKQWKCDVLNTSVSSMRDSSAGMVKHSSIAS